MNAFRSNGGKTACRVDLLPPDRTVRSAHASRSKRSPDVTDAEFEVVPVNSRRTVYPVFNDNRRHAAACGRKPGAKAPAAGPLTKMLDHFERLLQTASPKAFAILVTCLCAPVFLLSAGLSPDGPAVAAPPALSINGVTTALSDANGMKVVSVYGAVENHSDAPKTIPMIQVDVIAGGEKRTASRIFFGDVLAPGESRAFSARLPHAGGKLPEVTVSFGGKGDKAL